MKSSYTSSIDFGDILDVIVNTHVSKHLPTNIVEFGILDGFSLSKFVHSTSPQCNISAYDIFEDFVGNGANYSELTHMFQNNTNVSIIRGNFYDCVDNFADDSIDIMHIDIANNGDVYEFAFQNYMPKVKRGGIMILEGGSEERDNVEWMIKYDKPKIAPIIKQHEDTFDVFTVNKFPSMTIVKHK